MKKYSLVAAALVFASSAAYSATYQFDKSASTITWTGGKAIGKDHTGTVALKEGEIDLPTTGAAKGRVVIDMTTIANSDVPEADGKAKLEGHLKSDDFFKVDQFKEAVLVIKDMKQNAAEKTKYDVKGALTIRGTTQEVTFPATVVESAGKVEVSGQLNIDRTKYGVNYNSAASLGISDYAKAVKTLQEKVINNDFKVDVKLVGKSKTKA